MDVFALRADAPWWEVWRLWTCHLVHYDARHLALNLLAALPPLAMVAPAPGRLIRRPLAGWALIAAPLISLAILLIAKPFEYRGASALIMGLWFFVPLMRRRGAGGPASEAPARQGEARSDARRPDPGVVLIVLASIKLLVETVHPLSPGALPLAHWLGAAAGVIGARILARDARRAAPEVAAGPADPRG